MDFCADFEAFIFTPQPFLLLSLLHSHQELLPLSFCLFPFLCFSRLWQTTDRKQEVDASNSFQDPAAHATRMGCTTGHLACQTQPQTSSSQEAQSLEASGAKVPEVLSSLERLSQATGGMEKSWYRCIFPFGIISLVIGVAGTGVTYTYNDLPQTKVVSVVLLVMGLLLLLTATACWTVHKKKRRKKKEGGSFNSEQCPL